MNISIWPTRRAVTRTSWSVTDLVVGFILLVVYVFLLPLILWNNLTWKKEHEKHFQESRRAAFGIWTREEKKQYREQVEREDAAGRFWGGH